jgi:uncharacterized protein YcbK (DUF882 family)
MDPEQIFDEAQYQPRRLSRRKLLTAGAAAGGTLLATPALATVSALMCPPRVGSFAGSNSYGSAGGLMSDDTDYSGAIPPDGGTRHLVLTVNGLGERFDMVYAEGGQYIPAALEEFSRIARDKSNGQIKSFDPACIDLIYDIWKMLGSDTPFNLNSGYRSPEHNAALRAKRGSGVAKQSLHLQAKAADLVHPARSVAQVHKAASTLKRGGVGKYTSSGFVHVDTGRVRYWGS